MVNKSASRFNYWWWQIDRGILSVVLGLIFAGVFLNMSTTPHLAYKLKIGSFVFFQRHLIYTLLAVGLVIGCSFLSRPGVLATSLILFAFTFLLLMAVPFTGSVIKGAKRWINLFGFSLQPTELIKPALIVICAWLLSQWSSKKWPQALWLSLGVLGVVSLLALLQPDVGMTFLFISTWIVQAFVAGLSFKIIFILLGSGVGALGLAYLLLPHVHSRINTFLNGGGDDKFGSYYQIQKALQAFQDGGLFGKGPGEGIIKRHIPDAHADFIFSVAGEEFGFFFCLAIVLCFAYIFRKTLTRLWRIDNMFASIAIIGLGFNITLQALINIASNLKLIPTKGMALPFLSYGGSSLISSAIMSGFLIALTKRKAE